MYIFICMYELSCYIFLVLKYILTLGYDKKVCEEAYFFCGAAA
jgi:hypothetical protein